MATISTLAGYVQNRLEESGAGQWWSLAYEIYSALAEAQNDLMLLIGRPTQVVNFPFTLTPNVAWQQVPKGIFTITDIQGATSPLYKINLWDLDYLQSSWSSDWEQDVDVSPVRWAPIGFNLFVVHPAPSAPVTVNITGIQYPQTTVWPYNGTQAIVFEDNFFELLEMYAAHYCRIKEGGAEHQEGVQLLQQYLQGAQRMTAIQDRRDPLLFTMGYGGAQQTNPTTKR